MFKLNGKLKNEEMGTNNKIYQKKCRRHFESTVSMEHANEVFPIRKDRSNPCGNDKGEN